MKVMSVIKGITIKLQKRALDVVKAYTMVDSVIGEVEELRVDPAVFAQIKSLAESVGQTKEL